MKKEDIQEQLDRNKIFVVRYALFINLLIAIVIFCFLLFLKIGTSSILQMAINYYFKKK
jgi:hypothetical protein